MGHLLVVHWTQVSISNGFRDIVPQTSCAHWHNAKSSLRMRVTPYVKFKYIFQFLTPTLPIHYATFIELRWRIRGVRSWDLYWNRAKNFEVQKFAKFWPFRGPGNQRVWNVANFTAKRTSLRESTLFEPFCVKIGWGSDLQGWAGKSQKVTRGYDRNWVSPLTQGLNYRSACNKLQFFDSVPWNLLHHADNEITVIKEEGTIVEKANQW